ncbi:MAG TPA: DUF1273 domain-containing protein [Ruminococcaceae bacterium]|nr:DUF1273 domain-containing protein [Oscillospiraceae bacterium]
MIEESKTVCFTGHRPQSLSFGFNEDDERCIRLKGAMRNKIIRLIEECNAKHFISGMAIGIDIFAAEIVFELKNQYPQIKLECAIPCENQSIRWNERIRDRYFSIIEKSDLETMLQRQYTHDCMQKRNEYMVDKSDIILAIWNGKGSGTGSTVKYAKAQGKEVIVINPNKI